MASTPLEDYALLSDTHSAALVSRTGSIDWLPIPRFDSQAVFASLLGTPAHGHWTVGVADGEVISRHYQPDTFILETTWRGPRGEAVVTDFMPIGPGHPGIDAGNPVHYRHDLIRQVTCTEGSVDIDCRLRLRFEYGSSTPYFEELETNGVPVLRAVSGPNAVHVAGPHLELKEECADEAGEGHERRHHLTTGEQTQWVLTWYESFKPVPDAPDYSQVLETTQDFWRSWSTAEDIGGEYADDVRRSLLTLRALTDYSTGGVVAAPTTSLPEEFGGERNWDYRYVWLRDSALAIEVLTRAGFDRRAEQWRAWLLRAIAGDSAEMRIMYGLGGERRLPELELPHLPGYENSTPVRIGNGAAGQYQADVVGEVMVALEVLRDEDHPESEMSWHLQKSLLKFQDAHFDDPDQGIWEMRGMPAHFTHGRAMMWAAYDRGIRAVEKHGLSEPEGGLEHWRAQREKLRAEIMERGWNPEIESFTQTYGGTDVDASLLQLAQIGFVDYADEKMLSTVARIEAELVDDHGFLHRYLTTGSDGLEGDEYPFLICTCWLAEQYARSGRIDDADAELRRVIGVASDLGLLSEEYSTQHERLAGNFPQAFSHLGLVRAAVTIDDVKRQRR